MGVDDFTFIDDLFVSGLFNMGIRILKKLKKEKLVIVNDMESLDYSLLVKYLKSEDLKNK